MHSLTPAVAINCGFSPVKMLLDDASQLLEPWQPILIRQWLSTLHLVCMQHVLMVRCKTLCCCRWVPEVRCVPSQYLCLLVDGRHRPRSMVHPVSGQAERQPCCRSSSQQVRCRACSHLFQVVAHITRCKILGGNVCAAAVAVQVRYCEQVQAKRLPTSCRIQIRP